MDFDTPIRFTWKWETLRRVRRTVPCGAGGGFNSVMTSMAFTTSESRARFVMLKEGNGCKGCRAPVLAKVGRTERRV